MTFDMVTQSRILFKCFGGMQVCLSFLGKPLFVKLHATFSPSMSFVFCIFLGISPQHISSSWSFSLITPRS